MGTSEEGELRWAWPKLGWAEWREAASPQLALKAFGNLDDLLRSPGGQPPVCRALELRTLAAALPEGMGGWN